MHKGSFGPQPNKIIMVSNEHRELFEAKQEAKKLAKALEEHKRRENELLLKN